MKYNRLYPMTDADHEMREMFFDEAGAPMDPALFRKRYPTRLPIAVDELCGVLVVTEFVGINHNSGRGRIRIYETTGCLGGGEFAYSSWSSSRLWARITHLWTLARAGAGVALWWRWRARRGVK